MAVPFPDWNDLRDILLITDAGSLSGAARIAGISQSTMSRRLSAIEASGQPIFLRDETGRMSPNARGVEMVAAAREMAAIYDRLRAKMTHAPAPLRIAACDVTARLFLQGVLPIWSARAGSAADVTVHEDIYTVDPASYDVLLAPMAAVPQRSAGQTLGKVEMGLYAAPGYVTAHRIRGRLANLDGQGVIRASKALAEIESYRWLTMQGGNVTMLSPNVTTMMQACVAGLGIALLPVRLAEGEARLLRLDGPICPPCEIWMIADANKAADPRIAGFLKWARAQYRSGQASEKAAG